MRAVGLATCPKLQQRSRFKEDWHDDADADAGADVDDDNADDDGDSDGDNGDETYEDEAGHGDDDVDGQQHGGHC